jgi:hypothetical protein
MASPIRAVFPRTPTAKCMTDRGSVLVDLGEKELKNIAPPMLAR